MNTCCVVTAKTPEVLYPIVLKLEVFSLTFYRTFGIRSFYKVTFSCVFFFNKFIYLYFWLRWVFVAACRLSLVVTSRATLRWSVRASHYGGFSCCGARDLGAQASVAVACRLSSCGTWAQ